MNILLFEPLSCGCEVGTCKIDGIIYSAAKPCNRECENFLYFASEVRRPSRLNREHMRDANPRNQQNWKLVCSVCGAEFENKEVIDLANGHFKQDHPDLEHPAFATVWVGKGPLPKEGINQRLTNRKINRARHH